MIHWFRVELIIKLVDTVQWMKEDRSGEDSEWAEKVKAQVRVFKQNSEMNVYEELRDLKTYLIHRKAVREYEEKLAVIKANFDEFRRKHVEEALEKFDLDNKEKQEELKWKWSPPCISYLESGLLKTLGLAHGTIRRRSGWTCLLFCWRTQEMSHHRLNANALIS